MITNSSSRNIHQYPLFRNLLSVLFLFSIQFATAQNKPAPLTPLEFNDQVVQVVDTLYALGTSWGQEVGASFESGDFSALKPIRMKMIAYLDRSLKRVQAMKDVSGSKNYRQSLIDFLIKEKSIVDQGMKPFESLSGAKNDEERAKLLEGLTPWTNQENTALAKIQEEQSKYAAANGFSIGE